MKRITEHKNMTFRVFDSHIEARKDGKIFLLEPKKNFSVWRIEEKEFIGNLLTVWNFETHGLPEIAWIVIENNDGTKLARTYN